MVPSTQSVSSAQLVIFSPVAVDHLLVVTSSGEDSGAGLLKFSATNGQLLSEVQWNPLYKDTPEIRTPL